MMKTLLIAAVYACSTADFCLSGNIKAALIFSITAALISTVSAAPILTISFFSLLAKTASAKLEGRLCQDDKALD